MHKVGVSVDLLILETFAASRKQQGST